MKFFLNSIFLVSISMILNGCFSPINTVYNSDTKQLTIKIDDKEIVANNTEKLEDYSKEANTPGHLGQLSYVGDDVCSSIYLLQNKYLSNGYYHKNAFETLNHFHKDNCTIEAENINGFDFVRCGGHILYNPYDGRFSSTYSYSTNSAGDVTYTAEAFYITKDMGSKSRPHQVIVLGTEYSECYEKLKAVITGSN